MYSLLTKVNKALTIRRTGENAMSDEQRDVDTARKLDEEIFKRDLNEVH